jgi:hypothetical protein
MQNMVKAYFRQTGMYYSESKQAMLSIKDMNPVHAANAVNRLMLDADVWMKEAGETGQAVPWMVRQPLFRALVNRAAA